MKKYAFVSFAACLSALSVVAITSAPAHAAAEVGMLSCRSQAASSYIVVSAQPFDCVFTPASGAPAQRYGAVIHRFGAQIGFNNGAALGWAVFAATTHVGAGALAGGYGGVSAGAAVGLGAGVNGLVGGLNNSFALQPVSVEGQTGLNVVATVTGLELRQAAPVRHRRHRSTR